MAPLQIKLAFLPLDLGLDLDLLLAAFFLDTALILFFASSFSCDLFVSALLALAPRLLRGL
jgi:hypothetical protein